MAEGFQTPQKRVTTGSSEREELKLTPDELDAVLRDASTREMTFGSGALTTVDQALETARELGIPEEHVVAAMESLRKTKMHRARLAAATRRRRADVMRYIPILLFVCGIVWFAASFHAMQWVAFAMSIALVVKLWKWFQAAVAENHPETSKPAIVPGECRVCGRPAFNSVATYCEEHRIR